MKTGLLMVFLVLSAFWERRSQNERAAVKKGSGYFFRAQRWKSSLTPFPAAVETSPAAPLSPAVGQREQEAVDGPRLADRSPALSDIGIIERLGERIPRELVFADSEGKRVQLKELLGAERPLVLILAYGRCPMLCPLVLGAAAKAMHGSGLNLGGDFSVATVSLDPHEDPKMVRDQRAGYLRVFGRPADDPAWKFLTGDEASIHALADAVGFRYAYDEASKQFAHDAAMIVLTPDGMVSRYVYGVEFSQRDLRLALVEAGRGRVGTSLDRILLRCFRYDPASRRYAFIPTLILKGGALLVFAGLSTLLIALWRRELRAKEGRA